MTITTITNYEHDNAAAITVQTNYGPHAVGAGFKVTRIEWRGQISFNAQGGVTTAAPFFFADNTAMGIQYGAVGYTPYLVDTGAHVDAGTWFDFGILPPAPSITAWSPDTASAAYADRYPFAIDLHPQYLVPSGGIDIYFTVGPSFSSPAGGFRLWSSIRTTYHG